MANQPQPHILHLPVQLHNVVEQQKKERDVETEQPIRAGAVIYTKQKQIYICVIFYLL